MDKLRTAVLATASCHVFPGILLCLRETRLGYAVCYFGPSLWTLHATGCIDDEILDRFLLVGATERHLDREGDAFSCFPRKTSEAPLGVEVVRMIADREKALSLPGVRELLRQSLPPGNGELKASTALTESSGRRSRVIGRRRQRVSWEVFGGNVIVPLWQQIRLDSARRPASTADC